MSPFIHVAAGILIGVTALLSYLVTRMLRDPNWDDSNITNALRVLAHVTMHPGDLGKMFYLGSDPENEMSRPFWYINKDELSEVVKTRPPK